MESDHLLYDGVTGLPTLQAAVESMRRVIVERGELLILYFNFSRYSKIEEIYGWEKLDAVLATTAAAMRAYLHDSPLRSSRVMVRFTNDDDFVFFHIPEPGFEAASDEQITEIISGLQKHVSERIEAAHGEEVASLFDIYAGRSHVMVNPKFRLERQIYRGVRQAERASQSLEARETVKKLEDLRESIRTRGVYVDYHPIVVAETGAIFGYEALARGVMRSMRSPEVMFEVAARGDLLWELSRICRSRAIEGMQHRFDQGELLFLNVDPGDFADPTFSPEQLDAPDPRRVVIEITERTAIKDYPKFRNRLQAFRDAGYRFAVDDAGSGYAGLGSIANLEPDFIKLDISLISCIDSNFIKQNLVETMINFANDQGAQVIAEGVERAEELAILKELGVHLVQGFFLHPAGLSSHTPEHLPVPPPAAAPVSPGHAGRGGPDMRAVSSR